MKLLMFIVGAVFMYSALLFAGKIRDRIEESNFVRVCNDGQWTKIDLRKVEFIQGNEFGCTFVFKDGDRTTVRESYYKVMFRIAATTHWNPK